MKNWWLLARLLAWKYCWFQLFLALHRFGFIEWDDFEEAVMSPLRRMR